MINLFENLINISLNVRIFPQNSFKILIPLSEAYEYFGDSKYYEKSGVRWTKMGINKEGYCKSQMITAIQKGDIPLYGRERVSGNKKITKITGSRHSLFTHERNINSLSQLYSQDGEVIYYDLHVRKKDLKKFIKKLKRNIKEKSFSWPLPLRFFG